MNFESLLRAQFQSSAKNMAALAGSDSVIRSIADAVDSIVAAYRAGGCLYVAGNGGSAADAQHLVAELVSKLNRDRTPIRAYALTVDTSILTAIGNDYGYENVFSRQVAALMQPQDIFLGITTSGNSPNILLALGACRELGVRTVLLSGRDGGRAKAEGCADQFILAPGEQTAQIQEAHLAIYHNLCYCLENALVEAGLCQYV